MYKHTRFVAAKVYIGAYTQQPFFEYSTSFNSQVIFRVVFYSSFLLFPYENGLIRFVYIPDKKRLDYNTNTQLLSRHD
jgi:hypothetical protein